MNKDSHRLRDIYQHPGNNHLVEEIRAGIQELGTGPVMVHSDALMTLQAIPRKLKGREALDAHIINLRYIANDRGLWIPSFDSDFPSKPFNVITSTGRVGSIAELYRTDYAEWRTEVPMLSFVGEGPKPILKIEQPYDPYGEHSVFAELIKRNGVILFYGAAFRSMTMIHHIEARNGRPLYRYDKILQNKRILHGKQCEKFQILFHCRPKQGHFEYDFQKLKLDLEKAGLLHTFGKGINAFGIKARDLSGKLEYEYEKDPFAFLDQKTRSWIKPLIKKLGRRLIVSDIE